MLIEEKNSAIARQNLYVGKTKRSEPTLLLVEDWYNDSDIFCSD